MDYLEAIRQRVCPICTAGIVHRDDQFFRCGLTPGRTCPVERHLPEILEVMDSMDSPWMDDYVTRLRERVCSKQEQTEESSGDFYLKGECTLDTYFMLIAEAVEEVKG